MNNTYLFANSASFSSFKSDGTPDLTMVGDNHDKPFFPYLSEDCGDSPGGGCPDGSRYAIWPDSPPMMARTTGTNNDIQVGYTWIRRSHINGLTPVYPDPPTTLYRIAYIPQSEESSSPTLLPLVGVVDGSFWAQDAIPYGAYGNVIKDGTAYLYGQPSSGVVSLAKVSAEDVEDKTKYQYYVDGKWTTQQPAKTAASSSIGITNAGNGGQGTFYYSDTWQSYVWIGSSKFPGADFFITTAPAPEGPWTTPTKFYSGVNGNYSLPAYSLQAHPSMVKAGQNEIYISYTKNDVYQDISYYHTPLIHVQWQ